MWFNFRKLPVAPGNHAEVVGITTYGWRGQRQQGTLKVALAGRRTKVISLRGRMAIRQAYQFADRFNEACGTLA